MSMLKQEYKEMGLNDGLKLGVKTLGKTLDTNKLTSEKSKIVFHTQTCIHTDLYDHT